MTVTHRMKGTPTWLSWRSMNARVRNPNDPMFAHYGGRGITICDQWVGPGGFENFLADMGERPDGRTLGRIDNDGPYSPENCRWETWEQQNRNSRNAKLTQEDVDWIRSCRHLVTGKAMAEVLGVSRAQISRILNGTRWSE